MKKLENFKTDGLEELSLKECQEIEGGFIALAIAAAGLCVAVYMAGLATGRAVF
jgi:hypothetical protein